MPTPAEGYRLKDGTRVPGTTTILGRWKDSGGLLQWAFQQGRSGARSLYEERDKAADVGTLAHAMADNAMRGLDPELALEKAPEEFKPKARTAFGSFLRWRDNQRMECIPCETQLVSEVHRFGGTPDFLMRGPDGLAMADIKTSNGIYRDMLMQVAAYGLLWNETHPDDPITAGYHVARFAKEFPDFEHRYFEDLSEAAELFLLLRRAYDMDARLKKRAA